MPEIYLIAGERSGDNIGAGLMQSLKQQYRQCQFRGVGGDAMIKQGLNSLFPMNKLSLFGFVEVLPHIFTIKKLINQVVADIISSKVTVVITIDSPGFNFRVAQLLRDKKHNVKLVHYVAPTVWAYKEKRAAKCAKLYDCMLTLFPFEVEYFTKYGLASHCVGHPLFDYDYEALPVDKFRQQYNVRSDTRVICITPGSRKGEISRHMPILLTTINNLAARITNFQIFIAAATVEIAKLIQPYVNSNLHKVVIITDAEEKLLLYKTADLAIAKSGTNILEISACNTPVIVFYALNIISWWLLKFMLKIKFASVVNIIAQREIIPEFLQNNFTANALTKQSIIYLEDRQAAQAQLQQIQPILKSLGMGAEAKVSDKAAKIIISLLEPLK